MNNLEAILKENNIRYSLDTSVASYSTFKIGGIAAIAIFPSTVDELCVSALAAYNSGIKFQIIDNYYKNKVVRYDSDVLDRICKALNCDISDLIEYKA